MNATATVLATRAEGLLSAAQVREYWERGFLAIDGVLPYAHLEELRAAEASPEVQAALQSQGIAEKTVHLLEVTLRHPAILALARAATIIQRITPLLGPDIQLQHSKLATKPTAKGKGAFGWHQDFAYYPHTNTSLLSVFVYLDDTNPNNGGMSMVVGSHKLGLLNHANEKGDFSGQCQESAYWERDPGKVVPLNCRAGAISIHHCLTLHGSPVNESGRPRRGLVFSYRAADAYQLADTVFADTGLQVSGAASQVVRCEAATWRLPRRNGGADLYGSAWHQVGPWAQDQNRRPV